MQQIRQISLMAILCLLLGYTVRAQQSHTATGQIVEEQTRSSLPDVRVTWIAEGITQQTTSNADGRYTIDYDGTATKLTIIYDKSGYRAEVIEMAWPIESGQIATMRLTPVTSANDLGELSGQGFDLGEDGGGISGDVSPILNASRDPYTNKAGYQFSPMRFRIRGYDSYYQSQYLNGMQMNDMNNGYSSYALWNGLNNATRIQSNRDGLEPIDYSFGNIGGSMNILTRASGYRKGYNLTFSGSNRSYNFRTMVTYATGLRPSGWAIVASGSRRWGNMPYVQGQFYDAWGYFLSIEKQFDKHHALSLLLLAAPTERGVASGSTQEAYDLAGSNFYNPNVGYQNGKLRNARVRSNHEPILQLQHIWTINEKNKLTTGVGYRFGKNAYSSLNWGNGPDPRPDYYRNMPSYYSYMSQTPDPAMEAYYRELWHSDRNMRYIDWDQLYEINRNNHQVVFDEYGNQIAEGRRSVYVVEDRRADQRQFNFSTVWNSLFDHHLRLDMGMNYRFNRTANFNVIADLLGGDYWIDIDKYSERDFASDPSKAQVDLNNPNRVVRVGDKYSHNYLAYTHDTEMWGNFQMQYRHIDAYVALSVGMTNMHRRGLQRRGMFPEDSFGNSDMLNFLNYGAKAGITYKINGRHYLVANAAFVQKAPYFTNVFVSPRTRNQYLTSPQAEHVFSGDVSYVLRSPFIKGRITGFYTRFMDKTQNMSFYDDGYRAFSNYLLSNIDSYHTGVEIGAECKITPALSVTTVFTYGQYRYANNPDYIQTIDNSQKLLEQDRVYWNGFHVSGTPQTAANVSFSYQFPFYMWAGIDFNYFGRSFISMNPVVRTDKGRASLPYDYVRQEQFPGGFTIDANVGYSWRIKSGVSLRLNLSASNLLNTTNLRSGGYEQLRVRYSKEGEMMRPFDSRYFYMYGTTFFFNASLQF